MALCRHHAEPLLIVATIDPNGSNTRADAWRKLLEGAAVNAGEQPLRARIVTWKATSGAGSHTRSLPGRSPDTTAAVDSCYAGDQADHMLALVGRRPFHTREQLPSFTLPDVGTLVINGTATVGGTSYPFTQAIPFV